MQLLTANVILEEFKMNDEFKVEVLTPARELITTTASEVLLPTLKGEVGILPQHEDICGLLSTGTMKLVRGGNDFWFMISGGAFRIESGVLTVLAEYALTAELVNGETTTARLKDVESELLKLTDTRNSTYKTLNLEKNRLAASLEANRRHSMS